jgi:Protein of unknown function (DUF3768)
MHCSKQRPLCDALLGFHNPWQSDREGRPAAWLALDRDVAAHHLAEAFTDRESKARATVFARRGGGSLGKLLEQLAHLLRRHADGAFDADGQRVFFKIDYFDESLTYHSPDPADPSVTKRVITIMLAEEY